MNEKKYFDNLIVSSSPHLVTALDTQKTMLLVIIALLPALGVSTYVFGPRVLLLTAVSIALLNIYDMCKALSKKMVIGGIELLEITGGKSDYKKQI